ncbi:MAG: DNA polymerase III subunit alpha [Bacteroidetes bacterium]|nr:DNA polymerase III subunit alpha [Bacteroidota bacterium]
MYLNCHSYFSWKYGCMSPEEVLQEAHSRNIKQLALTDINSTSGILDFHRLAGRYGIKPVAGIDFRNGIEQKFVGLAQNSEGFRELNDYLSYHLHNDKRFGNKVPVFKSAWCVVPWKWFIQWPQKNRTQLLNDKRKRIWIGVAPDDVRNLRLSPIADYMHLCVMLAPCTFRHKADYNTHRLLRSIDNNTLLSKLPASEQAQPGHLLVHPYELIKIYSEYPVIIDNSHALLETCSIDFEFGKNKNKKTFTGNLYEDELLLRKLCAENLNYRYPQQNDTIMERYDKEIRTITDLGYAAYFLLNWDIVQYAQRKNYFYVGRGSGANSVVAYLLRITDVDPVDLDLYFERFINPYRTSPPDFDLDFSWKERDDVIDYIFRTHGHSHVAQLATYSTFQSSAVLRELGKVFGLPKAEIDDLVDNRKHPATPDHISKLIFSYGKRMIDFPNHLSIHAGGILISEKPMHYYTATSIPPKGFPLTHFSMLEAEDVGLYKFDILSQRGLGKVKDAVDIIQQNQHVTVDVHDVSSFKKDERIRANLQRARLIGCFYVESPAMRMLLSKLRASTYLDLVAASSIIRPGVAQSGMMREYILRFHHPERRQYAHPLMKELMAETYGVMVYQEDVIKVAHHFAGLELDEADMLRRGMSGKYRGRAEFDKVEKQFFVNCKARGYDDALTKEVWRQIESFAGYAFSKGHSASYAVESYQCMFLKTYYPLEYMVSCINNFGGFYTTEFYVHEARMCGATIHAPCVNFSKYYTIIKDKDIYIGFMHVAELEHNVAHTLIEEQEKGIYISLQDFATRNSISLEQMIRLIRIGAFRFTGRSKQQLLWDVHFIFGKKKKTEARSELFPVQPAKYNLPPLIQNRIDDAWDQMELLGFVLCSPFDLLKTYNDTVINEISRAIDLPMHLGKVISIRGYMVTRKPTRTKHGEAMSFGTFLDSDGDWIDTTHFPQVLATYPFTGRGCYMITGLVVEEFGFYSIDVTIMKRLEYIERFNTEYDKECGKLDEMMQAE